MVKLRLQIFMAQIKLNDKVWGQPRAFFFFFLFLRTGQVRRETFYFCLDFNHIGSQYFSTPLCLTFLGECSPSRISVSPDSSLTSTTVVRWKSLPSILTAIATSQTKGGSLLGKESSWTKPTVNTFMSTRQAWDSIGWRKGHRLISWNYPITSFQTAIT